MYEYYLRKSTSSGTWGIFYWKETTRYFIRYPKCGCPNCTGAFHPTRDFTIDKQLQPLFLAFNRGDQGKAEAIEQAKRFGIHLQGI